MDLRKLQNGSDIRGISMEGVPGEEPNLTEEEAQWLTLGFVAFLKEKTGKQGEQLKVSVGRDPRLTGKLLAEAVSRALKKEGLTVIDGGLASTPAMFMSTEFPEYKCDGAIMITASHLPYNRNGFKYFTKQGGLDKEDITRIIEYGEELRSQGVEDFRGDCRKGPENKEGSGMLKTHGQESLEEEETSPLMKAYAAHLRGIITGELGEGKPLEGLKIVVDAGNGSGGFFAVDVLKPLGADVWDSQYLEPDGRFPNHPPNPEDAEAIKSVSKKVMDCRGDLGLIFDTDVDRSAAVDHRGKPIARDGIVALASALVAEKYPHSTVVTDSITGNQLTDFLEKDLGLKHLRYKRGYRNVINKGREIPDAYLAIETSGHAAFRDNYFLDDGAYLATLIVIRTAELARQGKTLDSLISSLKEPAEEREVRIPIKAADFSAYGDRVLEEMKTWAEGLPEPITLAEPNYEGVRIQFPKGWCLLRKSLHDPVMPLNLSADETEGVEKMAAILRPFLKGYTFLDTAGL